MLITYYDLQVQKGILNYQFGLPTNIEIYLGEVKKTVDFETLKPKTFMELIGVKIDLGFLDSNNLQK